MSIKVVCFMKTICQKWQFLSLGETEFLFKKILFGNHFSDWTETDKEDPFKWTFAVNFGNHHINVFPFNWKQLFLLSISFSLARPSSFSLFPVWITLISSAWGPKANSGKIIFCLLERPYFDIQISGAAWFLSFFWKKKESNPLKRCNFLKLISWESSCAIMMPPIFCVHFSGKERHDQSSKLIVTW